MFKLSCFAFALLLSGVVMAQDPEGPKPIAPYSPIVQAGNTFYLAGQIPIDPSTGDLVTGDIEKATHVVMKNIGILLKKNGLDYSNIVKCTVYLKDLDNYQAMNKVYGSYFKEGKYPARVAVEVARLPLDADVEIASIAVKK